MEEEGVLQDGKMVRMCVHVDMRVKDTIVKPVRVELFNVIEEKIIYIDD